MVANQHYFQVTIGNQMASFAKVSGMEQSMEYEPLQEGGMNWGPWLLPIPQKQLKTLRFERGLQDAPSQLKLIPGMQIPEGIGVTVMDISGDLLASFVVKNVTVIKWELGVLDAQNSGVLLETFEIAYGEIFRVK